MDKEPQWKKDGYVCSALHRVKLYSCLDCARAEVERLRAEVDRIAGDYQVEVNRAIEAEDEVERLRAKLSVPENVRKWAKDARDGAPGYEHGIRYTSDWILSLQEGGR